MHLCFNRVKGYHAMIGIFMRANLQNNRPRNGILNRKAKIDDWTIA